MENLSVVIWNELSRFAGVEEVVYIRRRWYELVDVVDNRTCNTDIPIYSGSMAEGLSLPGSDIDFMFVSNNISVSCSDDVSASDSDIVMDTNDIKPGFVRLYCHKNLMNHDMISPAMSETKNGLVLSSLLMRDTVVENYRDRYPDSVGHGPCSSFVLPNKFESDVLYCFSCKNWPKVASEWIDRNRNNNWPLRDLITEIVHGGCLIVPIGNPNSQESHLQWRLSFSIAEKKLVHSFNHTQFLCYALLKLYLKHVINANPDVKDLMCSYFLKTSLFYSIEEEHVIWNKENFLDCFWLCYRRLMKWVRDEYCPNYFIKDNNMFEGKICGEKRRILLRYLSELYHEGEYSFWRIPCLAGFNGSVLYRSIQIGSELSNAEKECFCDSEICKTLGIFTRDETKTLDYLRVIAEMIKTTNNTVDRALLVTIHIRVVWNFVQTLFKDISKTESNKSRYNQIKGLKSFIVQNCMDIDKCTGMLLLATLGYLCREYKEVVTIVINVLKMFPCTFYTALCTTLVYNDNAYIGDVCGKHWTLYEKFARGIWTQSFRVTMECRFYPLEIERELVQHSADGDTFIHPVVYSHVLLFLSYYHMNSRENISTLLNEFYIAVHDEVLIPETERSLSNSLLQRCIQLWESWQNN